MLRKLFPQEEEVPFSVESEPPSPRIWMRIGICILIIVCIVLMVISLGGSFRGSHEVILAANATHEGEGEEPTQPKQAYVHVLGCVASPGVYSCEEGSRLSEVIAMAGGMTDDAAEESVNLASVVTDGTQVMVRSKNEVSSAKEPGDLTASQPSSGGVKGEGKVNINTATASELTALNGIGTATAEKIIAYREKNGAFSSIQDLTKVSGIGEKRLESLKDHITV